MNKQYAARGAFEDCAIPVTSPRNYSSAREYVYTILRDLIMSLQLAPGAAITEKGVSERLKVSPTPIREAFVRLAQEGLLVVYPQRSTYVTKINLKRTMEARLVRRTMEREIVNRLQLPVPPPFAMEMRQNLEKQEFVNQHSDLPDSPAEFVKLDNAFHRLIFVGAGLESVWDMIKRFSPHNDRLHALYFSNHRDWSLLVGHHRGIFEAMTQDDKKELLEAWKRHFGIIIVNYEQAQRDLPDYFD